MSLVSAHRVLACVGCSLLIATVAANGAHGRTLVVPTEYPTLEAAIDSAASGDLVMVLPGIYSGPGNRGIELVDKGLTILGGGGEGEIVVDCDGSYFLNFRAASRDARLRVQNVTVMDASGFAVNGGAVTSRGATLELVGCTLAGNSGGYGGAVRVIASDLRISDCTFKDNNAERGGAVGADSSNILIERTLLVGNMGLELGGALYGFESQFDCVSCTFVFNSAHNTLASVLLTWGTQPARLDRCITVTGGGGDKFDCSYASQILVSCSDFDDWGGCLEGQRGVRGNFQADPLFCDLSGNDLRLRPESPCLPGNHPDGANCGLIGTVSEVCGGPTPPELATWGRIKALFGQP